MRHLKYRAIDWWRRQNRNRAKIHKTRIYPTASGLPKQIDRHCLAIAGDPPTWAAMECPCGNGHRLQVRIRQHAHAKVWDLKETHRGPSLYPSVDFESADTRCHFWLENGRVRWVEAAG